MKKVTLTVMAVLFAAAVATSAFAFGWGRGPGYGPCGGGDFDRAAGLNLAPEQTAKIKEMREAQWNEMKPLREQMFTKRDEVRKLWLEPNPDQGKIAAAQKEMRSFRDQIQDKMTAYRLDALKTLTPEQQEKIRASFSERGFGPGRGMGPGGWGGGMMGPGGWGGGGNF
ncbi:MAG: Spy/CpxP family protein refolding chaperone [Proteobacteria bacterium]|nr:Spy/CpxP family protein refolding chaperone [Pseudomonadota bacterium]MBU1744275.1 Spy/CpxP family protein refolding chaperone [Pseudomonadota bacterium]